VTDASQPAQGHLIVLEGAEGVGKSTQLAHLASRLRTRGRTVTTVREPGGTPLGEAVRGLLLDPAGDVDGAAEALLYMASRAQLVAGVVRPALERGEDVLLDRFFLSTYAYQVGGRGLPDDEVRAANRLATGGLVPHLTIVLVLPAGEGLRRASLRGSADRLEAEAKGFHDRVDAAFSRCTDAGWQRSHPECGPIVAVDGMGPEAMVAERIASLVFSRWPETFPSLSGSERQ
jgi:dTMP kinase